MIDDELVYRLWNTRDKNYYFSGKAAKGYYAKNGRGYWVTPGGASNALRFAPADVKPHLEIRRYRLVEAAG